jgi:hypothetical protein
MCHGKASCPSDRVILIVAPKLDHTWECNPTYTEVILIGDSAYLDARACHCKRESATFAYTKVVRWLDGRGKDAENALFLATVGAGLERESLASKPKVNYLRYLRPYHVTS